jgi:cysteine synthase A
MPDTVSKKHISLIKTLDAIVVLTPGNKGIEGALKKAKQLRDEIPGAVMLEQFADKVFEIQKAGNIWEYACENADILVVSKNTDKVFQSQISNLLSFLKVKKPNIKTISVESEWKKDLTFDKPGYDIDETITVENEDASETAKEVAITEGLILDMLSGAVVNAATLISQRKENFNKTILAVLPDITERNISTTLL